MIIENQGDSFETLVSANQDLTFDELKRAFKKHDINLDEIIYMLVMK